MKKRFLKVIRITASAIAAGCSLFMVLKCLGMHFPCIIRTVTLNNIKCPTCGATRATMRLSTLDIKGALEYNPMIFLIWLYIIRVYIIEAGGYIKYGKVLTYKVSWIDISGVVIMVCWAIIRNVLGL